MGEWICTNIFSVETGNIIRGITVDSHGIVYCTSRTADNLFSYLWKIIPQERQAAPQMLLVQQSFEFGAVVWTPDGNLYIYDRKYKSIFRYNVKDETFKHESGNQHTHAFCLDGKLADARYRSISGMTLDKDGNIYISDHNIIRKIDFTDRAVRTIAGTYSEYGSHSDGPISSAKFKVLHGISLNNCGTILVCQGSGIRKIENGEVSILRSGLYECALMNNDGTLITSHCGKIEIQSLQGQWRYPKALTHIQKCTQMVLDHQGSVFAVAKNCVYHLENSWKYERFLWIGRMKEDRSYCLIASLPVDIIREIALWMQVSVSAETSSSKRALTDDENTVLKKSKI